MCYSIDVVLYCLVSFPDPECAWGLGMRLRIAVLVNIYPLGVHVCLIVGNVFGWEAK